MRRGCVSVDEWRIGHLAVAAAITVVGLCGTLKAIRQVSTLQQSALRADCKATGITAHKHAEQTAAGSQDAQSMLSHALGYSGFGDHKLTALQSRSVLQPGTAGTPRG